MASDIKNQGLTSILERATEQEKEELVALKEKIDSDDDIPEELKEDLFIQLASLIVSPSPDGEPTNRASDEAWKMIVKLVKEEMGIRGVWILQDDTSQPRLRYVVGDGTGKRTEVTIIYDLEHDCIQVRGGYHFRVSENSMAFAKSYACKMTYQWRFTSMCLDSSDGEIYVSLTYPWRDSTTIPEGLERCIQVVTIAALEEYENVYRYANDIIADDEVDTFVKDVQKSISIEAIAKSLDGEA